jgi:hypothetical protein
LVLWQSSQVLPLAIWFADLPVAMQPFWQLAHVPSTETWSTRSAGAQRELLWQFSQVLVVAMWVEFLPVAVMPLWQLAQFPDTAP